MKRVTFLVFFLILCFSFVINAYALDDGATHSCGSYFYTQNGDNVTITRYIGDEQDELIVPFSLDGHTVTIIGNKSFKDCPASSIILPDTVEEIESDAFYYCKATSINIPNSVKVLDSEAFMCCGNVTSFHIPASVEEMGTNPFRGCRRVTSFTVDEGNKTYTVFNNALVSRDDMRMITYPFGLIGKTFEIPNGIKIIGGTAFGYEGPTYEKLIIPDSVESIEGSAFCFNNVKEVQIGSGVKSMGYGIFTYCGSLRNVVISEGATCIGNAAFSNCENLETITIPDSIASIAKNAFSGDYKLLMTTHPGNYAASFAIENGITLSYSFENLSVITLPSMLQSIEVEAFANSSCEIIIIPEGCSSIASRAFANCKELRYVRVPKDTLIADDAFAGCERVTVERVD